MRCAICGGEKQPDEMMGIYCGRCDHIYGSVMSDLQAEYGPNEG